MTPGHGDRVLVTGASGFIGSALVRALMSGGEHVVALVHPGADNSALAELDVEQVPGDVRDPVSARRAVAGCRSVFHVAALYRFWDRDPRSFYAVNVDGTRTVLTAAREASVERVVYTSTVGTIGVDGDRGRPASELDYPDVRHLFGAYKRSKYVAEHEVLRAAAEGLPVSLVLPTFPLGPGDRAPTPTGQLVLDFLDGRMPGYVDTALNVVHVEDVARGHILARDRGASGRSYILGGQNLALKDLLAELAACTGLPAPTRRVPRAVALGVGWLSDTVEGRLLHRPPHVPLEAARMSSTRMAFDDARARSELGYTSRPAAEAVRDSVHWFVDNRYVRNRRRLEVAREALDRTERDFRTRLGQ
ncbi:SDR family oxidoreductase [Jatrophihabitans cynanchi]|uniref:SDR family oxidoreductase n=1 Tax=Jatrophihabitans cynanchi TaxID=2944128 RepID=A0ABY7K092_9ACTN|nr:hopanoid-associated sugar epimerase [Jatrophihabitans sp. SB3-54]WAX57405.1 SDR family oxidoreductase [Jatrophihabitans sp. SB3-54]